MAREHFWRTGSRLPELRDEWIEAAEAELGVKLPDHYIALLREENGGGVRFNWHPAPPNSWSQDSVCFDSMFGIGSVPEGDLSIRNNQYFLDEWDLPQNIVLLSGDGHYWIALDYRPENVGEPAVVFVTPDGREDIRLAESFESFVDGLEYGFHDWVFGHAASPEFCRTRIERRLGILFTPSATNWTAEHAGFKSQLGGPSRLRIEARTDDFFESNAQTLLWAGIRSDDAERFRESIGADWQCLHAGRAAE